MQQEQQTLLSILRSTVTGEKISLDNVNLPALLKEASAQAVSMIVCDALSEDGADSAELKSHLIRRFAGNAKVGYAQSELVRLMEDNGFAYVILKGESAAAYYPKPELRSLGDVDFLIDPNERERVERMLLGAGYEKSLDGHICHVVFRKPDAYLEMHFEVAGLPNGKPGEKIRAFLRNAVRNYTVKDIGDGKFRAPEGKYHAMILLLHMQHHFLGEGIGLRHLCDWAYFIHYTREMDFWAELIPLLREIGLLRFAAAMTKVCVKYLGVKSPEFGETIEDGLCERIMEDIFEGGNFGKKDGTRAESFILVSNRGKTGGEHGKLYYLFYALNAHVKEHFYRFRKVYILYPVFYVCVGVKYLYRVATGRRTPLHKLTSSANKRKELFESLRVFERE